MHGLHGLRGGVPVGVHHHSGDLGVTMPRVLVAAPQGRSGKTTVCIGLCAALAGRELGVQPFKEGPDYIDPSWLSAAAGRACRNLDLFMMSRQAMLGSFHRSSAEAGGAVIRGARGLYACP